MSSRQMDFIRRLGWAVGIGTIVMAVRSVLRRPGPVGEQPAPAAAPPPTPVLELELEPEPEPEPVATEADSDEPISSAPTRSDRIALRLGLATTALIVGIVAAVIAIDVVRTVLS
jgi:hypothetical protein